MGNTALGALFWFVIRQLLWGMQHWGHCSDTGPVSYYGEHIIGSTCLIPDPSAFVVPDPSATMGNAALGALL